MLDMSYQVVYANWTGSLALDKLHRLSLSKAGADFECFHFSCARIFEDGERDASGIGCVSTHTCLFLHV